MATNVELACCPTCRRIKHPSLIDALRAVSVWRAVSWLFGIDVVMTPARCPASDAWHLDADDVAEGGVLRRLVGTRESD